MTCSNFDEKLDVPILMTNGYTSLLADRLCLPSTDSLWPVTLPAVRLMQEIGCGNVVSIPHVYFEPKNLLVHPCQIQSRGKVELLTCHA